VKQLMEWAGLLAYFTLLLALYGLLMPLFVAHEIISIEASKNIYLIGASVISLNLILYILIYTYSRWKWKMPDKNSVYNIFTKHIELHLGRSGNVHSIRSVIRRAEELGKNIYFVTDHIEEKMLVKIVGKMGYRIEVKRVNLLQKALYYPKSMLFKKIARAKPKKYPCIACTIFTSEGRQGKSAQTA